MRRNCLLIGLMLMGAVGTMRAVDLSGSNYKAIAPSSQWTPAQTWTAQVMIFNNGERYGDAYYNRILGTPPADASGKAWYEPDYTLTDNGTQGWEQQTSPFSSDEYYKGQKSSQWVVSDIMADIYLRRSFTVTGDFGGDLYLSCGHDDAPSEWYINGVLVKTVSDGWNNDETYQLKPHQKNLIKTDGSENIIAVHVHQNWGGALADCGIYEDQTRNTQPLLHSNRANGPWDCVFYELDANDEIAQLDPKKDWAGVCVEEIDWAYGEGPFSNSFDQFRNTEWDHSQLHPLLVRRHFTLTEDILNNLDLYGLELECSYDEDPKVYLNGTLIWSAEGWNDNDYASYQLTEDDLYLLREGDNVLAISLEAGEGGAHVDYGLNITTPYGMELPSGIAKPQADTLSGDNRVFNIMGQQVGTTDMQLPKGLYIVKGNKIVIR